MIKNFANSSQGSGGDAYHVTPNRKARGAYNKGRTPVQVPAPGRTHTLNDVSRPVLNKRVFLLSPASPGYFTQPWATHYPGGFGQGAPRIWEVKMWNRFLALSVLILVVSLVLLAGLGVWAKAYGSPFLVCDPYPTGGSQPDQFSLVIDGGSAMISPAEVMADGKTRLHYDLAGIATGTHSLSVKAQISLWGLESTAVPFSFTKPASAASPAAFGLVK